MLESLPRVYRTQVVQGVSIPAIIRNGSYFFTDLDVYENGRVNCWNFQDFEAFKKDVRRGWVSLQVPDGEALSIHGLGSWVVASGHWRFTPSAFITYVKGLVRALNPALANLYTYHEKTVRGVRVGEMGTGTVFREDGSRNSLFPEKINGDGVDLFYKADDEYQLVKANVFADDTLELTRLAQPVALTFAELEKLVADGALLTDLPAGATVSVHGLGTFVAQENRYVTAIADKVAELHDIRRKLGGGLTTIEACRLALERYQAAPTTANRAHLKETYEAVPDHQKMYVGDMDTKDVEVRMILYGEQEIENWSHYQVAKHRGDELPGISIPEPEAE